MGLDTDFDCWSGGYIGFNIWRNEVARAAGYSMGETPNWPGRETYLIVNEPCWQDANFMGKWRSDPPDPLLVLLIHSDCDGYIARRHLLPLADRLAELIPALPEPNPNGWDHRALALRFVNGLRAAAVARRKVEFW